jgi:hypothetical protein
MNIRYINNAGGGFNGRKTVDDDITIDEFFAQVMPSEEPTRYNIRVNNQVPVRGQALRENDLVSIIPGKYDGGALFGSEFLKNLRAASELGKLARQTPDLTDDLRAINDLGAAIKAVPDLAENISALTQFVQAVRFLDQPAPIVSGGDDEASVQLEVSASEADVLRRLMRRAGGETLQTEFDRSLTPQPGSDQITIAVLPGEPTHNAPPLTPDHVRLVTGYGLGREVFVPPGETALQFFNRLLPGATPDDYRIEINGSTVEPDYVLTEGDNVVIVRVAEANRIARGATHL